MHRKRLTKPLTMREPIFRNMSSYSGLEKPLSITDASVMSDETWRGIIIRSIPRTERWLPVIPSLCAMSSSADIILTLFAHGMIIGRNTKASSNSSNTVLVAQTTTEGCTNPNCKAKKRSTHTTANCYWPGGGKEGQFPANFGQRNRANAVTLGSTNNQTEHFVLSAVIPDTPGQSGILIDDHPRALVSQGFQNFRKGKIPTFMDSGASNTMFVSRDVFSEYKSVTPRKGDWAKAENGSFEIVGEGHVVQRYQVDGREREITYTHALHTPTLNANLVSVGALDKAGLTTTFGNGKGVTYKMDGTVVLSGQNVNSMYLLESVGNPPDNAIAMTSLSKPTSLEQWHRRLTHCSPLTIQEMARHNLVDGLIISDTTINGKCEDCIMGRQTRRPFDGETEKDLGPLSLVSFDLWGPSRVQSAGGKVYLMIIVDAGTSYKHGAFLADKSDNTTLAAFKAFHIQAENTTGRKLRRLRADGAFNTGAWKDYTQQNGIVHELTAPYSSSRNGLAERAIRTTIDDVRTLLRDSGLNHSYWAEAAAYSIYTRNLIPSRRSPDRIPGESFTGKRQGVGHLRVFGSKCWAKIPTMHGIQVTGGSKLDVRSVPCRFLRYALGHGNYKVQDIDTRRVYVSRDVVFEEGLPCRTLTNVGENQIPIPLFDIVIPDPSPLANTPATPDIDNSTQVLDNQPSVPDVPAIHTDQHQIPDVTAESRRSTRVPQPSNAIMQSAEYQQHEAMEKSKGNDWATDTKRPRATPAIDQPSDKYDNKDILACLTDTKASHFIPRSYRHAMSTDPERWMVAMKTEMDTLKTKHTWNLIKPPPGANIMDSMWVYNIKWDGEGNRIKDKARLVGKGYTQQLGVDYNKTWAAVTRLESVRMTSAIAAKLGLKLWRLDFVGAYLNSVTKEDIYVKQPEGFVEPGFEDYVCKLVHTIYGTMQGGHDWFVTLRDSYDDLGYTTSRADPCIRFKKEDGNYTIWNTNTANQYGASNNDREIEKRKEEIGAVWDVKDVGETEYFLGMRVQQDLELGTVRLTQKPYWEHVINRFNLESVTPRNTPLPVGIVLNDNMSPKTDSERKVMVNKPYRSLLGCIMWGQLATRPDLSFAVSLLSQFQANPGLEHWTALLHVVGYIKNTITYGITYSCDFNLSPSAYVNTDFGGCRDTRQSTSGYVFTMAGGAVSWSSTRQAPVELSTVE